MKRERTITEEVNALDFMKAEIYLEREYLEKRIESGKGDTKADRVRLEMVNHFIDKYERY